MTLHGRRCITVRLDRISECSIHQLVCNLRRTVSGRDPYSSVKCDSSLLTLSVTAILVSRFLIDLQQCSTDVTQDTTVLTAGTLNFNRVLGSIASSLPAPGEPSHASELNGDRGDAPA